MNKENWYMLFVAIECECTIEQAMDLYYTGKISEKLTDEDTKDMIELKKTCTYKEIGAMYYISDTAVFHRLRRYKEKVNSK